YNIDVEQTIPLPNGASLSGIANYRYQGERDTSLLFTAGSRADSNKYMDANIQYRSASGKWDVSAFVNNLINQQPVVRAQGTGANGIVYFANVGTPRTYGVRTNFRF